MNNNKYLFAICSICDQKFNDFDDIVVCDLCGAPYHKSCYISLGYCYFSDRHDSNFIWKNTNNIDHKICTSCGKNNGVNGIFCDSCGASLCNESSDSSFKNNFENQKFSDQCNNDLLSDVSISDISKYVGQSSTYFLSKFKQMDSNKGNKKLGNLNFSAFLFDFYYFAYRKMYLLSLLSFIIFFILSLSGIFMQVYFDNANFLLMFSFISIFIRVILAKYFNKLYMNHCLKSIKKIKRININSKEKYEQQLVKTGGVSKNSVLIILIGLVLLFLSLRFILTFVYMS